MLFYFEQEREEEEEETFLQPTIRTMVEHLCMCGVEDCEMRLTKL